MKTDEYKQIEKEICYITWAKVYGIAVSVKTIFEKKLFYILTSANNYGYLLAFENEIDWL